MTDDILEPEAEPTPDPIPDPPPEPIPEPTPEPASAPVVARLCNAANLAALTPVLLAQAPLTEAQVKGRIVRAATVRQICAAARQPERAEALILADADEATAKLACWDALIARAEASPVDNTPPAPISANLPLEERCTAEWQRDPQLRAEFGEPGVYFQFMRAKAAGHAKILGH